MAGWFPLLVGLLLSVVLNISESQTVSLTLDQGARVTISRQGPTGPGCTVCVTEGSKRRCSMEDIINGTNRISVEFTCLQPHKFFTLDINRKIVCKGTSCSGDIIQSEPSQFQNFNRTFTWDLEPERPRSFRLSFTGVGLRQVLPSETCPGLHTYTIVTNQSTGTTAIGTFCPSGTISSILALSQSQVVLQVPGGRSLDPATFKVSVGPEIKTLALVKVVLPSGSSATKFFSPNYPVSFPDDDLMTWDFEVPSLHNYTVRFLNYTEPQCIKKDVSVEYHRTGNIFIGKTLRDPQPANRQGNFSLTLRNCEMDTKVKPGLTLNFQVSVVMQAICAVDLQKEEGVVLSIAKKDPSSHCRMKKDSVVQETIKIASGNIYNLSFPGCVSEELILTMNKTIECQQLTKCLGSSVLLSAPALPPCLPTPLRSITWHLRPPQHGTVELLQPTGNLRQLVGEQPCNASFSLTVREENGDTVGTYCPVGPIQKIQIHYNVSVIATPTSSNDLSKASKPFLSVSFNKEISERYIFSVVPRKGVPVLLATPSWPVGMNAYSTVSWIVQVPPAYRANLLFLDVNQPKCSSRHTVMKVQTLGSREEMFSRREDENAAVELSVPETFYLNMSSCVPEEGAFSVLSQITLQENTRRNLGIILGTVIGVVLLVLLILTVVCVVIRKKKAQAPANVSIYNPNGVSFVPGHYPFPKSRADNESHIYASIEDTMVYGHLLQGSDEPSPVTDLEGRPQVDIYRSFTGPTEAPPPLLPHIRKQEKLPEIGAPEVDVYRPFIHPSESALPMQHKPLTPEEHMVENEVYSPGSNGVPSPHSLTPGADSKQ
ncbi:CUB domain-containing protein 1-like [Anguilla anguilla]|uniref:CUB domain-containing protein 1-like n=1 Tax=Anguilla anguilla TaxID=7936 RepID=UPI0015A91B0F|nr:CUB domain-containing protein 1-like [Anguilla anguilla]